MIRLFTGFDNRESAGWHAFAQSVIENTSEPVAICALTDKSIRDGSNAFTYSRFLVPYLCGFEGHALFLDGADMVAKGDLAELWALRSDKAVHVVKHDYKTRNQRKYVGTDMECANSDYPRKNWSSAILWNCSHPANYLLTPKFIEEHDGSYLHRFAWLPDWLIGELPKEWNWLADEDGASTTAKLLHWTAGIPSIPAHRNAPHASEWFKYSHRADETPKLAREAA